MTIGLSSNSPYLSETVDESSSSKSPLLNILRELKRKHVVAAAVTSGMPAFEGSSSRGDVLEGEDHAIDVTVSSNVCKCTNRGVHASRLSRSFFIDSRNSSSPTVRNSDPERCITCGKRIIFDPIGEILSDLNHEHTLKPRSNTLDQGSILMTSLTKMPEHAESLLNSTPHLRHLSPASVDMQGYGNLMNSRGIFSLLIPGASSSNLHPIGSDSTNPLNQGARNEYDMTLSRDQANLKAAAELESYLHVLTHEKSFESFGQIEGEVFPQIFSLIYATDSNSRMAGVAALHALIDAPTADEEQKVVKFANILSNSLRASNVDYEFLSAASKALGYMAIRATNVDFVESEITHALEWLRSDRSQRRYV
jgi:hypothetical protein